MSSVAVEVLRLSSVGKAGTTTRMLGLSAWGGGLAIDGEDGEAGHTAEADHRRWPAAICFDRWVCRIAASSGGRGREAGAGDEQDNGGGLPSGCGVRARRPQM
jgi:hypothetical protein